MFEDFRVGAVEFYPEDRRVQYDSRYLIFRHPVFVVLTARACHSESSEESLELQGSIATAQDDNSYSSFRTK